MKTIKIIFTGIFLLMLSFGIQAQPDPPGEHGSGDDQGGGNAPIGSGLVIMTILSAAYGGKKAFDNNRKSE